jgi:lipopolysaccharide transport system permease protein
VRTQAGLRDLIEGFRRWELWGTMGWYDVRQQYRRSILGPFWLTLSMAIMVCALGIMYGGLFGHSLRDYLPYLSIGLIFWGFMSTFMIEGCTVFSGSAGYIQQLNVPLSIYVFRLMWRNLIVLAHNSLVLAVVALVFSIRPGATSLLVIPGLFLVCLNGIFASFLLGVLSARFRDIPPIVANLVQVLFFLSPILWKPDQIPARALVADLNPIYHLMTIVREPLLGRLPSLTSWGFSLALTFVGAIVAGLFFIRFRSRIAYWV